jgi:ParB family chromosome partitioning protein
MPNQADVAKKMLVKVSPHRCRIWIGHDRLEEYIDEQSCQSEIQSFVSHGQMSAVLGRPLKDDPSFDVELIFGARRLFVARALNVLLDVELRDLTDREAAIHLDIENRHRREVSPYERGMCYMRWLRSGLFSSQEELAQSLKASPSHVSRLLAVAKLPSVIVSAFPSPLEIREMWGVALLSAFGDMKRRRALLERARVIAKESPRPPPDRVFERLTAVEGARASVKTGGERFVDEVVRDRAGRPLFRIRRYRQRVAFVIDSRKLSRASYEQIRRSLTATLQVESVAEVSRLMDSLQGDARNAV